MIRSEPSDIFMSDVYIHRGREVTSALPGCCLWCITSQLLGAEEFGATPLLSAAMRLTACLLLLACATVAGEYEDGAAVTLYANKARAHTARPKKKNPARQAAPTLTVVFPFFPRAGRPIRQPE